MWRNLTQKDIEEVSAILGDFVTPSGKSYLVDEAFNSDYMGRQDKLAALRTLLAQFGQSVRSSVQVRPETTTKLSSNQNQSPAVTFSSIESRLEQIDKKLDKLLRRLEDISDRLQR